MEKIVPDNWVVADSEGEENVPYGGLDASSPVRNTVSLIQSARLFQTAADTSAISSFTPRLPQAPSEISLFSTSAAAAPGPAVPKPRVRPRPRPIPKTPAMPGDGAVDSSISNVASTFQQLDPIQTATTPGGYTDGIESFSLSIAERSKTRSRSAAKSSARSTPATTSSGKKRTKRTEQLPPISLGVVDISSDDVDDRDPILLVTPRKKSKGPTRSRSSSKRPRIDDPEPQSTSQPLIPPSSPRLVSSQLPPSDFPPSTAAQSTEFDLPPIETLPNNSSPPSSPFPSPTRARKRKRPAAVMSDDELAGNTSMNVDKQRMPPPPGPSTFFAASSSSSAIIDSGVDLSSEPAPKRGKKTKVSEPKTKVKPPRVKKTPAKKQLEVVILSPSKKGKEKKSPRKHFEDDDNDREDPSILPAIHIPKPATAGPPAQPPQESELSSVPDSEPEAPPPSPTKKGRVTKKKGAASQKAGSRAAKKTAKGLEPAVDDVISKSPPEKSRPAAKRKGKGKVVLSDEEDEEPVATAPPRSAKAGRGRKKQDQVVEAPVAGPSTTRVTPEEVKENHTPVPDRRDSSEATLVPPKIETPSSKAASRAQSIVTMKGPKSSVPLSELLRRVNSLPSSPFSVPRATTAHSPYAKNSRSLLMNVPPLHPNRRTPPPPPPRPQQKKTKKMQELEEKWEEELADTIEGWACLSSEERASLLRSKIDREMGYGED